MPEYPILTAVMNGMSHQGDALGRMPDGRALFVPFALPGETVRIEIIEQTKRYARGRLLEILQPAPERIAPRCKHFTACGGCHLQHMPYEMQLRIKVDALRNHLEHTAGIKSPMMLPPVPSPSPWQYRNHVQFDLSPEGKLGFHALDETTVIPITECFLPASPLEQIWPAIDLEVIPDLERISLRVGADEEILVLMEGSSPEAPEMEVDFPISIVYDGPKEMRVLAGREYLAMEILGRLFQVSAPAFFQVNTSVAEKMVAHILEHLPARLDLAIDLYCGGGLFSAFLAPRCQELIGIEADPAACLDFETNLDEFDHVSLYEAGVGEALPALDLSRRPDLVLADPPRSGIGQPDLGMLLALQPYRIVYVSCNPAALAKDATSLVHAGYILEHITPFDMFPQTYHLESVSFWKFKE